MFLTSLSRTENPNSPISLRILVFIKIKKKNMLHTVTSQHKLALDALLSAALAFHVCWLRSLVSHYNKTHLLRTRH